MIELLLATVTFVAAVPPKMTDAPETKPVPVIVTAVPPLVAPELGETEVIVGAGKVSPPERVSIVESFFNAPGEVLR